jgi:glycosyltransferase involved in cell wall biosynthesis
MVVVEALAHGVPVLTTRGAPWEKLKMHSCGWWVDPTSNGITDGLRLATKSSSETLQAMGQRGREMVAREYAWGQIAKQFIDRYQALLEPNRGSRVRVIDGDPASVQL